jgi:hypothetical protein
MAGGRRAVCSGDGDEFEGAGCRISFYADQHGQPSVDLQQSKTVERSRKLEVQVMETSSRVLGVEYPSTLTSMANLASTYRDQGRWKEAEELEVQMMETT